MTNRVQIFRTPTTGVAPAAGTRLPGELWVNFADFQLGMVDASKNAQKLVAVRYFVTTANYAVGDFVIQAGVLYVAKGAITAGAFNATQWTQVAAATDANGPYLAIAGGTLTGDLVLNRDPQVALGSATKQYVDGKVTAAPFLPLAGGTMLAPITLSGPPTIPLHAATKAYVDSGAFVPIAGGTMTGPLVLAANPAAPLQPATKQYVDALPAAMNDNRIINGDMRIDQRNGGASGTANANYTVDRWMYFGQANKGAWGQNLNSVGGAWAGGFAYNLGFKTSSAYASLATDYFLFQQRIEADMVSDFAWGGSTAQPITLSFWAQSSLTGTFSGAVNNAAGNRSYPFAYSLPTANTWTKVAVSIPGDTAGTWVMSGSANSVQVVFDLGTGATYRGPANAWASVGYNGVTGAVSVVSTLNATFYVTGVKLEIGSVATPYNRQSLAKSMADCQRYYEACSGAQYWTGNVNNGSAYMTNLFFKATKRAAPTMAINVSANSNLAATGTIANAGNDTVAFQVIGTATSAYGYYSVSWTASAEL